MNEIEFGIHWLCITVHAPNEDAFTLYELLFQDQFGTLIEQGHGGKFFKEVYQSTFGFKLYLNPSQNNGQYFFFEIPGQACELISWPLFLGLGEYLRGNFPNTHHFPRIDMAFDNLGFTPDQAFDAIIEGKIRSLAKRESLSKRESPFEKRDNGEKGTCTIYFGDRSSERMIRVYNQHGFTRLEIEMKEKRANLVAGEILSACDESRLFPIMVSHLRDFIDFDTPWWNEFVSGKGRAWATVSEPREITLSKMVHWVDKQVAPTFSALVDILPEGEIDKLVERGRKRRGAKFSHLLPEEQELLRGGPWGDAREGGAPMGARNKG